MTSKTVLLSHEEAHKIFDEVVAALTTIAIVRAKSSVSKSNFTPAEMASGVYRLLPEKTGIEYIFVGISLQLIFNDLLKQHV